jgi:hypothetical protein
LKIKIDPSYYKHLERTIKQDPELLRRLRKEEEEHCARLSECTWLWYADEVKNFDEDKERLL